MSLWQLVRDNFDGENVLGPVYTSQERAQHAIYTGDLKKPEWGNNGALYAIGKSGVSRGRQYFTGWYIIEVEVNPEGHYLPDGRALPEELVPV